MKAYAPLALLLAVGAAALETAPAANLPEKPALLKEIEDWKVLLPADPAEPLHKRLIPPLHRIKLAVQAASTPQALSAARASFEAWKTLLKAVLYSRENGRFAGGFEEFSDLTEKKRRALVQARDVESLIRGAGPGLGLGADAALSALKSRIRSAENAEDLDRLFENGWVHKAAPAPIQAALISFTPQAAPPPRVQLPSRLRPEAALPPPSLDEGMIREPGRDYAALRAALTRRGVKGFVVDEAIRQARAQGVDPLLVLAMIQAESSFRSGVVSSCGAIGLMQIMPGTGRGLGVADSSRLFDPATNIRAGVRYMKGLWDRFAKASTAVLDGVDVWSHPGVKMVVAAYNAGPGAVRKYGGVPPYKETQKHVIKVLTYFLQFKKLATPVAAPIIV